jgi:hypothetical protein
LFITSCVPSLGTPIIYNIRSSKLHNLDCPVLSGPVMSGQEIHMPSLVEPYIRSLNKNKSKSKFKSKSSMENHGILEIWCEEKERN